MKFTNFHVLIYVALGQRESNRGKGQDFLVLPVLKSQCHEIFDFQGAPPLSTTVVPSSPSALLPPAKLRKIWNGFNGMENGSWKNISTLNIQKKILRLQSADTHTDKHTNGQITIMGSYIASSRIRENTLICLFFGIGTSPRTITVKKRLFFTKTAL